MSRMAHSIDPDEMVSLGAISSGSMLFANVARDEHSSACVGADFGFVVF